MAAVLLYVCSTFVVWMCCLLTHSLVSSLGCPSSCDCLKNHAKCSQNGLVNIPKGIPPWIKDLDFQDNGISEIRPDDFKGLDNIEHLLCIGCSRRGFLKGLVASSPGRPCEKHRKRAETDLTPRLRLVRPRQAGALAWSSRGRRMMVCIEVKNRLYQTAGRAPDTSQALPWDYALS
ncbi:biglycan [Elysia marginata]|uniref:Biglycan n=1 Tax=Elysia marginata TaxID=1093978 RepID=A0AAV4EUM1_9GAST|nr:biglycan [Elysia marginata]